MLQEFAVTPVADARSITHPESVHCEFAGSFYNVAAASTAPAVLKVVGFVISILTGYFHSMNFAQPVDARISTYTQTSHHADLQFATPTPTRLPTFPLPTTL